MTGEARGRPWRLFGTWLALAAAGIAACLLLANNRGGWRRAASIKQADWTTVRRTNLETKLVAGGELRAAKEASIACEVEDLAREGGALIVWMIDNGTLVKKGDELCRFDSSALEEVARAQEIQVIEARSAWNQARLALEVAQTALREYAEGQVITKTKEYEGKIALSESDCNRQADRLVWTEAMYDKGYVSRGQVLSDRQVLEQSRHDLRKTRGELDLFRRQTIPKETAEFRKEIRVAEANLKVETDRLKFEEDRLAHCRKQIDNCVIRAPSDGVVIHANHGGWWSPPLEAGVRVYQQQKLFMLPDLTNMEVELSIHETMGPRVRVGMPVKVRIASIPDQQLPARIVKMDLYPVQNDMEWDERLKHYVARARLDVTPPRVLPMMSAVVEIDTGRVDDALVIPVEAMSLVQGRPSCRVLGPGDRVESRPIVIRHSTPELVEVVEGLAEGDRVLFADAPAQPPTAPAETGAIGRFGPIFGASRR